MYELTDIVIENIRKELIRDFSKLKSLLSYDELNVMSATKAVYSKIDLYVRQMFLQLMQAVYKKVTKRTCPYNYAWLESFLLEYDEVSKYVYANEFERKRDRLAEALIASPKKNEEIDAALRYLSFMLTAYAVRVTDQVVLTAYRDMGIDAVRWKAEKDNKTCTICKHRNGHIYDIEQIPPKPHLNCRCEYEEV
jgi:SPP1 gp7 family putative phage head morphogenesis protein